MRLTIHAPDTTAAVEAFAFYERHRLKLADLKSPDRRAGYWALSGDRRTVRHFVLYGTPDNPKVACGHPEETPEWMLKTS